MAFLLKSPYPLPQLNPPSRGSSSELNKVLIFTVQPPYSLVMVCAVQEIKKIGKRNLEIDFGYKNICRTYINHRKFIFNSF
jgi:hypothetical protein